MITPSIPMITQLRKLRKKLAGTQNLAIQAGVSWGTAHESCLGSAISPEDFSKLVGVLEHYKELLK